LNAETAPPAQAARRSTRSGRPDALARPSPEAAADRRWGRRTRRCGTRPAREVGQQCGIELATRELGAELGGVHAGEDRPVALVHEAPSQCGGVLSPE